MRFTQPAAFVFALVLAAVAARPALAAWPHEPNTESVPIVNTTTYKTSLTAASDGAGGAIFAWMDYPASGISDVYAQHIDVTGVARWAASGVPVCTAPGHQLLPAVIADGAGGVFIAWYDQRAGNYDVYAQHLNAAGNALWAANGVPVCTAASNQQAVALTSDGAGGAIILWTDDRAAGVLDLYAQRINAAGAVQWTSTGASVCTAAGNQQNASIISDGAGGAIVSWQDYRGGSVSDVYVQRLNAAGAALWTADGVVVTTAANSQVYPQIVTDGAGGAILAWADNRTLTLDIYAQHVDATGEIQWVFNGSPVCAAAGVQSSTALVSDGAGGAIIAWDDTRTGAGTDVYAQHMSAGGSTLWTPDGLSMSSAIYDQSYPVIATDGAGGAIIAWQDTRNPGAIDVYAQRVTGTGSTVWSYGGVALCTADGNQPIRAIVPDNANGAIFGWADGRIGTEEVFAGRIERFGKMGEPAPAIASVKDVPADQGGRVKVSWYASYLDADPNYQVSDYTLWRSAPPNLAARALSAGARLLAPGESPRAGETRAITTSIEGAQTIFWELVGTQPAAGDAGYSMVTATTSDSLPGSNARTLFRVRAQAAVGTAYWNSPTDSGYSVDNLVPATPAPFTGQYAAGTTQLFWGANTEPDLAGYRLYRGTSTAFVPAPGNLLSALAQTGYADVAGAPYVYKLTAIDAHGNESAPATLVPAGTLGVDDEAPRTLSFAAPGPNPARGVTTLEFTLTREGHARLALYDAAGRRVQMLRDAELAAGTHRETFTLNDEAGHALASGIYLVRLEAEGRVMTRRVAVVR